MHIDRHIGPCQTKFEKRTRSNRNSCMKKPPNKRPSLFKLCEENRKNGQEDI